ncbi:acetyl esterase/lipase [Litorimonas taeanensis]|uniref:Acetyl esterase/lipase n=1 Tax=Litorimonas taeanensis TaxID=568099 RepID=A0A420WL78_9PROT|nr:alpha/beta hydrolase [Litorimonas taeanensis]RKQ71774.1 acetyl esterase/lipase [Litorimonas taeanensis]
MKITAGVGVFILSALIGAVSCAPVTLLNAVTPSGSYTKSSSMSYGDLDRQSLDIYRTDRPREGAPVLVFIHGGSWTDGNKDMYKFLAEGFTSEGFDVVIPNYRLYPEVIYPEMIVDTAKAAAFTSKQFPGRPIVLMGHSAGAYNVLMTALSSEYLETAGAQLCNSIAGVVSLAGPTGIIPLDEDPYITIFPDRFTASDAPLNNVDGPTPPIFFGHGTDDKSVYPQNSERLAEKIQARGGQSVVKIYEGMNHIDAVKFLSRHFDGESTLKQDIIEFVTSLQGQENGVYCQ